jgi:hypothetical protein
MKREEGELRGHYGREYEEYAARVSLFWPALRAYKPQSPEVSQRREDRSGIEHGFSRALYVRNREYQALIGFFAVMALLCIITRLRS